MNKMMLAFGMVLVIVALILGAVQLTAHVFTLATNGSIIYYGVVGVIGLIGIIITIWSYMKKPTVAKTTKEPQ